MVVNYVSYAIKVLNMTSEQAKEGMEAYCQVLSPFVDEKIVSIPPLLGRGRDWVLTLRNDGDLLIGISLRKIRKKWRVFFQISNYKCKRGYRNTSELRKHYFFSMKFSLKFNYFFSKLLNYL